MSVEYFDQPSLKHFLRNGEKHVTSVCQRWIVPKAGLRECKVEIDRPRDMTLKGVWLLLNGVYLV